MSFIKRLRPSKGKACLLSSGVLLGLSAPGYGLWPLAWVMLVPVFVHLRRQPSVQVAWLESYLFGFAFHLTWMVWLLGLHPLTWLGFNEAGSLAVAVVAWLTAGILYGGLMSFILLLYWRLCRLSGHVKIVLLVLFPAFWVLGFNLLQYWALGVPWAYLQYTQHNLPLMRDLAAFFGSSSVVAGLIVLHNVALAQAIEQTKTQTIPFTWRYVPAVALPALLGLSLLFPDGEPQRFPLPVAVLQGNLGIDVIRAGGLSEDIIEHAYLRDLKTYSFAPGTLVILPEEGAVDGIVPLAEPAKNPSVAAISRIAQRRGLPVMSGAVAASDTQFVNALLLVNPRMTSPYQVYAKRKLVPFGEFTPYLDSEWLSMFLSGFGASYVGSFDAGRESRLLQTRSPTGQAVRIGGLICFELIYPELSRLYQRQGANLLVNTSNLGWFHGHPLLERQFLAIGQMRAAETRLPLVISSNTGISAIIASNGQIIKKTPSQHKAQISF